MKRSEMIDKIKELIEINLENLSVIPDASLVSALILEMQERSGMVPPINEKESFQILDNGKMTYEVRQWDEFNVAEITRAEVSGTGKIADEIRRKEQND